MVGARLASAGLAVVTGGYGGTMEAASKGAVANGGMAIGVTAPKLFTGRSAANEYVTREIQAGSLSERLGILTSEADGVIALPGSIGTATELLVSWNLNHITRRNSGSRLPTVAVGGGWRDLARLMTTGLGAFGGDIATVATAEEAVDWLLDQPEMR
jgi:uncharacterized protein (TIGR00725 family)